MEEFIANFLQSSCTMRYLKSEYDFHIIPFLKRDSFPVCFILNYIYGFQSYIRKNAMINSWIEHKSLSDQLSDLKEECLDQQTEIGVVLNEINVTKTVVEVWPPFNILGLESFDKLITVDFFSQILETRRRQESNWNRDSACKLSRSRSWRAGNDEYAGKGCPIQNFS